MTTGGSNLGSAVLRLTADASPLGRSVAQAEADTTKRLDNLSRRARALGTTFAVAGGAVTAAFGLALKTAAEFEQSMAQVRAVSGATNEEFADLTDVALEMGQTTVFTARQSADALSFMAMAGLSARDSIEALPDVLNLAAAGQLELAQASDIVTNVMAGYGIEASEVTKATDVLTAGFTSANTDLVQLGQAFKYAGPVAKSAGLSFEETSAALSLMGNAGLQASVAGTGLRGSITRLLNPSNEARDVLDRLGVTATDSAGNLLPLRDIISQFETVGLSAGDAMTVFGQRAGPSMLALIEQGSDALGELQTAMEESGGTAQRIADTQLDTLSGSMTLLSSATEGLQQSIGQILAPTVRSIAESLTAVIQRVQAWAEEHPGLTKAVVLLVAALGAGAGLVGVLALGLAGVTALSGSFALMGGAVVALTGKVVALGAALGVSTGGLTIIIGALVTGLGILAHHFFTSGGEAERLATDQLPPLAAALYELREATGETSEAIDSLLSEALAQLEEKAGPAADAMEDFRKEFRELQPAEMAGEIEQLEDEVGRLNAAFEDSAARLGSTALASDDLTALNDATRKLTIAQEEYGAAIEQQTSDTYKLAVEELAKAQRELTREQEAGTLVGASLSARQEELNRLRTIAVKLAEELGIAESELDETLDRLNNTTLQGADVLADAEEATKAQTANIEDLAASVEGLTGRTVELTEDSGADLLILMAELENSFGVVIPQTGDLTTDMEELAGAIEEVNQGIFSQQLAWDNWKSSVEQAQEAYETGDGARARELLAGDRERAANDEEALDELRAAQSVFAQDDRQLWLDLQEDKADARANYWRTIKAIDDREAEALVDSERRMNDRILDSQERTQERLASNARQYEERRADLVDKYNLERARAAEDFGRRQQAAEANYQLARRRAIEKHQGAVQRAAADHQRKLASLEAKHQRDRQDAVADYNRDRRNAQAEFRSDQAAAERRHRANLERINQRHEAKREDALQDHQARLAAIRRDALRDEQDAALDRTRNQQDIERDYQRGVEELRRRLGEEFFDTPDADITGILSQVGADTELLEAHLEGMADLQRRRDQALEDLEIDHGRTLQDIARERERKEQEALVAHNEKLAELDQGHKTALREAETAFRLAQQEAALAFRQEQRMAEEQHRLRLEEMDRNHKLAVEQAEADYLLKRQQAEEAFQIAQELAEENHRLAMAMAEETYRLNRKRKQQDHETKLAEMHDAHLEQQKELTDAHNTLVEEEQRQHQLRVQRAQDRAQAHSEAARAEYLSRLHTLERSHETDMERLVEQHQKDLYGIYIQWTRQVSSRVRNLLSEASNAVSNLRGMSKNANGIIRAMNRHQSAAGVGSFGQAAALAAGGIVRMPTLAMVGEAGPEAVIPLPDFNDLANSRASRRPLVIQINGDLAKLGAFIETKVLDGDLKGRQEVFIK